MSAASAGEAGRIRLVVSDVDGTLVDSKKQVTPGVQAAVAKLRAAGIGFSIISARPRSGMMPIAETLGIDSPMGAFNGGTVFTRDGNVAQAERIDRRVVDGVFEAVEGAAVDTWVFADDQWYATTDVGAHVDSERRASNQQPVVTPDFGDLLDRADKITFVSDDPDLLIALRGRMEAFADAATIVQSQTYYLDVTPLSGNKGDGLKALSNAMNVPLSQIAVLGDQANDLPMFAQAAISYAMGQGPEAVRAKASHVVASNDQDGVAEAIAAILAER
jgi:Cof subfamily protein (haloacid dehalogenase superfamily)